MAAMKFTSLAFLALVLAACQGTTPSAAPAFANDADALEVVRANRTHANDVGKRLFIHIGAPW